MNKYFIQIELSIFSSRYIYFEIMKKKYTGV